MQTVITITAKDHLERANIARQIRAIAARLPDRIEEDPPGNFPLHRLRTGGGGYPTNDG